MELLGKQYRIDECIGRGGFGEVYRGYDTHMERTIAIKVVDDMSMGEANLLKKMNHPGLPELFDVIRLEYKTYIIMEWIEGINLNDFIEANGALSEAAGVKIGQELLEILKYLHSFNPVVVYQDLKPSNIILQPDGHIRLVDFGAAVWLTHADERIKPACSVGYGAPEQVRGDKARFVDERSDIYSWGAVMYSIISGILLIKPPYTMSRIRRVAPHISFGLAHIITKATASENTDRYQNVDDVISAVEHTFLINYFYRTLFAALSALCILPLIFSWYGAYRNGLFAFLQKSMSVIFNEVIIKKIWTDSVCRGLLFETIKESFAKSAVGKEDIYLRDLGYIFVSIGWMLGIIKLVGFRKYFSVKRSVYLSERRYPGLWIASLTTGILLGGIIGTISSSNVAYAAKNDNLPVCLYDDMGNKMLIRYGTICKVEGNLGMEIDASAMNCEGEKELVMTLTNFDSGDIKERRFYFE